MTLPHARCAQYHAHHHPCTHDAPSHARQSCAVAFPVSGRASSVGSYSTYQVVLRVLGCTFNFGVLLPSSAAALNSAQRSPISHIPVSQAQTLLEPHLWYRFTPIAMPFAAACHPPMRCTQSPTASWPSVGLTLIDTAVTHLKHCLFYGMSPSFDALHLQLLIKFWDHPL